MGYMKHYAILVTGPTRSQGSEFKSLEEVWGEVLRIGERHGMTTLVSSIVTSAANHLGTFMVAPDGSKEGWNTSDIGDKFRDDVVAYLEKLRDEDRSTSFDYAEVQFGDDEHETRIVRDSDSEARAGAGSFGG